MMGLACMAGDLANLRNSHEPSYSTIGSMWNGSVPVSRRTAELNPECFAASAEYYRIIDRISRGEKP
jgi:hypothetical protein